LSPFRELAEPLGEEEELSELEAEGFATHAIEEVLGEAEAAHGAELEAAPGELRPGWPSVLLEEVSGPFAVMRAVWERAALLADIAAGVRSENDLTNKVFYLRHPDRRGTKIGAGETAIAREWREIRDRQVIPLLLSGPLTGPMHSPVGGALPPSLRKGVPADAVLSPLAIAPRGLRASRARQPGTIAAVVVHMTSRGPANRSRQGGYKRPAVEYALDHYIRGREGCPHYVVDFNGTVYATCDERFCAAHAGWVHPGGRGRFTAGWTAPAWWSGVWSRHGIATPIDLLPAGTTSPNQRTIGIELLILPDLTYTSEQYRGLARLLVDIRGRHPGLAFPTIPGRTLLGHEDFAPVTGAGGRADAGGGWDPGAHRENPYFSWRRVEEQISAVSAATGGGAVRETVEEDLEHDVIVATAEDLEPDSPLLGEEPGFVGRALERALVAAHMGAGDRDENSLTNTVFFRRHPELPRGPLKQGQESLMAEWRQIRDTVVRPALGQARAGTPTAPVDAPRPSATSGPPPTIALGTLTFSAPGWKSFSYRFTTEDLNWTARFLEGEAGGRDNAENRAVLWAMFNRYAFFRNGVPGWGTFGQFLRQYSTPLQPQLRSSRAAYRHWQKCVPDPSAKACNYVSMAETHGYYPGTQIPVGQLRPFVELQRRPWERLSAEGRNLATLALQGAIPNLIGTVSEFGDTAVYWRDANKVRDRDRPTRDEWLAFTRAYVAKKKWIWPSDTKPYDQYRRNVLFVNGRARNLTSGATIVPP
jgi:hypothetical protein